MDNKLYKLMNWPEIESIVYSECDHPYDVLGAHEVKGGYLINAFFPFAETAGLFIFSKEKTIEMEKVDEEGFFSCFVASKEPFSYEYVLITSDNEEIRYPEVYRNIPQFWTNLSDKLAGGIFYDSYRYLGAHFCERKGVLGTEFMVYAHNAERVSVVGDFNSWDGRIHQMQRLSSEENIFAIFIPGVTVGSLYKFEIKLSNGLTYLKRDPYALSIEKGAGDASRVIEDPDWETVRYKRSPVSSALSILNISLSKIKEKCEDAAMAAKEISQTVKEFSYEAVLLEDLGFCENKDVSDFGKPSFFALNPENYRIKDMISIVDFLHLEGIKVFVSVDLGGFLPDDCGLRGFDGTHLYEFDDAVIEGLLTFDFNKSYVRNYLISVCDYFVRTYFFDGIVLGGVDRIIYLNYGKKEGEYRPNIYGGCESVSGIEFIKHLNSILHKKYSNIVTIARDSLVSNNLTLPLEEDGLGFDFKIHTQFDRDFSDYMALDFKKRTNNHISLTYSPVYIYCEKFILSYLLRDYDGNFDSIMKRFPGNEEEKKSQLRLFVAYPFFHPGRKCLSYDKSISSQFDAMVKDLLSLYSSHGALSENDTDESFAWINAIDSKNSAIAFYRRGEGKELIIVANFSDKPLKYTIGVKKGSYKTVFSTDDVKYGGSKNMGGRPKSSKESKNKGSFELLFEMEALSLTVFENIS